MGDTGDDADSTVNVLDSSNNIDQAWIDFIEHSDLMVSGSGPSITGSSTRFFNSTFAVSAVEPSFEISQALSDSTDSLLLGLESAGNNAIPTSDILSAFDISSDLPPLIAAIVTVLNSPIDGVLPKFQIDVSNGSKNGTWLIGLDVTTLEIATALTLVMNPLDPGKELDFGQPVHDSLKSDAGLQVDLSSLKFSSSNLPRLRLKHRAIISKAADSTFSTGSVFELIVEIPISGFLINLRVQAGGTLSVGLLNNGGNLGSVVNLLANGPSESEATISEPGILDSIKLWKVIVRLPDSSEFSGTEISFEIAFIVTLHLTSQPVTIGLSYDTQSKTFSGSLLLQDLVLGRLNPNYNDLEDLPLQMLATPLPAFYDLAATSPFGQIPKSVPTRLIKASISYTKKSPDSPYELRFSGAMVSAAATAPPHGSVPFPFDWSGISLDYYRRGAVGTDGAVYLLSIKSTFELAEDSGRFSGGDMFVSFDCVDPGNNSTLWTLSGSARFLQLGAIAKFFDPDLNGQVLDILGKLSIDSLDVSYTYQQDFATSFLFSGVITFGDLQLKFYYQYTTAQAASDLTSAAHQAKANPTGTDDLVPIDSTKFANGETSAWQFDAYLDTVGGATTVGQIADSFLDNALTSLPGFVAGIQITSQTSSGPKTRAIFLLDVAISSLEFTLEQISTQGGTGDPPSTKRLLRVSASKFPLLSDLPVVKELPQPWQKLQYMWSPASGFTRDEVAALTQQLELDKSDNKLYFKPATKDDTDPTATNDPVVLVEGHHFIVVYNDQAVLDHVFDLESDAQQPSSPQSDLMQLDPAQPTSGGTSSLASTEPQGKPPSKGALTLNLGFLSITAVSLQYKQGHLYIFIDATLALGPLELTLIGFGIGLNISAVKLNDLSTLASGLDFQLHGMEVSFDQPPIVIAGCFYHDVTQSGNQTVDAYRGGIAVSIPPYTFVAVGEYAIVTNAQGEFKSVFVFAKLDGPIIDFEFAILKGLRIGFGYNSSVRSPAVEELSQFPLIDNGTVSGAGNHPIAILEKMEGGSNPFVQLKQDNYWLAFGFTISSFDLVDATIVALVQFGDAGCIFSLFGDLTISFPPDTPPDLKLFNIEIIVMAELNFVDDVFKLEAALAPTSFILVPYCKLFGGLALYTFFGSSPHAGDWVLSVGGYHRLFDVPAWYPRPTRIGLDFNISIIHIRGEGYFAITPKAIMAGCMIRCELHLGPVYAWLDAAFDAMVQFTPLHYWVSMHVEVGVECDIPILFCTLHIRIHIGAGLDIQGPQFGGTAYVDFWFFSFSFEFGAAVQGPPPISLQDFYLLCEKSGPTDTSPSSTPTEGLNVKIKMSLEDGSFSMPAEDKTSAAPPDDTGAGTKWFVKGGSFQFRVSSVFAITQAYLETEDSSLHQPDGSTALLEQQDTSKMHQVQPPPSQSELSSLPMQLSADLAHPGGDGITSKMCIAIQDIDEKNLAIEGFKPSFIIKAMPQTLWADPNHPPDRLSQGKGTIDLPMAVTISPPDPVLSIVKIPQFNATDMAKECAGGNKVPGLPSVPQQDLLPEAIPTFVSTPTQQWASMQQTWSDSSNNNLALANDLTKLCMTTLGWDKPPPGVLDPAKAAGLTPWAVPVAFPSRLVTGTGREAQGIEDGLDSYYLELPQTTVAPVH